MLKAFNGIAAFIVLILTSSLVSSLASASEPVSKSVNSPPSVAKSAKPAKPSAQRTEIKVHEQLLEKMKDLSAILQMVKITPLVDKKSEDTLLEKTTHSARSPGEVMQLYAALVGASRVDVDIKRGKNVVPMSYVLGD